MFFTLIFILLPALNIFWWLWADRKVRKLKYARRYRTLIAVFAASQVILFWWVVLARWNGLRTLPPVPLLASIFLWHLLILPITLAAEVLIGLTLGAAKVIRRLKKRAIATPTAAPQAQPQPTRRDLLASATACLPPLITAGLVGYSMLDMRHFRIRTLDVSIPNLPPQLIGLTIAHISDIHVGRFTSGNVLEQIVEKTNALNPDLILYTGDLIDFSLADLPRGLEILHALRSRYGLFMCEGNHDLFEDRQVFERRVKNANIPLLLNESQTLTIKGTNLQLMGLRWSGGRPQFLEEDLADAMQHRRDDAFPILISHHPHAFDAAAAHNIPLTLTGHTHGGQLMLTNHIGAGPLLFKYWSGLYRNANSSLIVSNGVGNWFPLRIQAPAEILHLTLRQV